MFDLGKQRTIAYVTAIVFIGTLITIAFLVPNPTAFQYTVFRIILALAAAGFIAMVPGFIEASIGTAVRASGAIAVFVVVYFFSPALVPSTPLAGRDLVIPQQSQKGTSSPPAQPRTSSEPTVAAAMVTNGPAAHNGAQSQLAGVRSGIIHSQDDQRPTTQADDSLNLAASLPSSTKESRIIREQLILTLHSRRLTADDLEVLNPGQLRILRNAIWASRGYVFMNSDLAAFFRRQPWYVPGLTSAMSAADEANVKVIEAAENASRKR